MMPCGRRTARRFRTLLFEKVPPLEAWQTHKPLCAATVPRSTGTTPGPAGIAAAIHRAGVEARAVALPYTHGPDPALPAVVRAAAAGLVAALRRKDR